MKMFYIRCLFWHYREEAWCQFYAKRRKSIHPPYPEPYPEKKWCDK